jgi:magnesium transporter
MASRWKKLRRMKRVRSLTKPGTRPGTISVPPHAKPTTIRVMAYDQDRWIEESVDDPSKLQSYLDKWTVVWVDVVGLGSEEKLRAIGKVFSIHPLALEDVVHVYQRAKVDEYENNLFVVLRIPDTSNEFLTEQFSLFLGDKYVVTFQERPGDNFDLVRAGLRVEKSVTLRDKPCSRAISPTG